MSSEIAEMTTQAVALQAVAQAEDVTKKLASVFVANNLAKLNDEEKASYYMEVCKSTGLNPATRPFEFMNLGGRTVLYASKGCTDQLRKLHGVSVEVTSQKIENGLCIVNAKAIDSTGRTDIDVGAVPIENLKGESLSNAIMKAITKAKRRVTLSICGLGMLDESEIDSIPGAKPVRNPLPSNSNDPVELELIKDLTRDAILERLEETFATFAPAKVESWISSKFGGKKSFDELDDGELQRAIEIVSSKK